MGLSMAKAAQRGRDAAEDNREGGTTVEEGGVQRVHDKQVRSDRDRRERRGDGQRERDVKSEGWTGGNEWHSAKETEEGGRPEGEQAGSGDTLTASPRGTQEGGAGGLQVGAQAIAIDDRKPYYATADQVGTRGRQWAR